MKRIGLSTFNLKIIAIITMLIDHTAIFLNYHNYISADVNLLLRGIGRLSFPIFAFMLVNGFQKTRSKSKYFNNLILFAAISQIPYTMANNMKNAGVYGGTLTNSVIVNLKMLIGCVLIALMYILITRNSQKRIINVFVFVLAITGSCIQYSCGGFIFMTNKLNVMYNLAIGILGMETLERIYIAFKERKIKFDSVILLILFVSSAFFIGSRSNYGYYGVLLMLGLYVLKKSLNAQVLYIVLWSCIYAPIAFQNVFLTVCTALSAVIIYFYNGEKGRSVKYLFYGVYPGHLIIIGIINLIMYFKLI